MDPRPPDRTLSTYCQNPAPLLKSEQYIVYKLSAAVVRWGLEGLLRRWLSVDVATGQQPLHARYPLANHRTDNKSNKRKECEKVRRARQSLWRPSDEHESNLEPMYTHHPPSTRWERRYCSRRVNSGKLPRNSPQAGTQSTKPSNIPVTIQIRNTSARRSL